MRRQTRLRVAREYRLQVDIRRAENRLRFDGISSGALPDVALHIVTRRGADAGLHVRTALEIGNSRDEPVIDETTHQMSIGELACLVGVTQIQYLRAVKVHRAIVICEVEGVDAGGPVEVRRRTENAERLREGVVSIEVQWADVLYTLDLHAVVVGVGIMFRFQYLAVVRKGPRLLNGFVTWVVVNVVE